MTAASGLIVCRLTLPEPPAANRYWRIYRGRAVKSAKAREYGVTVLAACRRQATSAYLAALPMTGPVGISLDWYRARKQGDLDGRAKVVLDALQGLLYVDDKQIVSLTMHRYESPRKGRLEVALWTEAAP